MMKRSIPFLTLLLGIVTCPTDLQANIRLPALIGDNMVLQQGTDARIWGWANPDEKITVSFPDHKISATTTADQTGKWTVNLPTPQVGGPYSLQIQGNNRITLENIMVGEVWICSGQSNMDRAVATHGKALGVYDFENEVRNADYPDIRLFIVQRALETKPVDNVKGAWKECSPATVGDFSAVGYFYGRELYKTLGIPVGLIEMDWGGSTAEAWTSPQTLKQLDGFKEAVNIDWLKNTDENKKKLKQLAGKEKKAREAIYKDKQGVTQGYAKPDFDDSNWDTMIIPRRWENSNDPRLKYFDGLVWFRKKVELPKEMCEHDAILNLGTVDDVDDTYINGTHIGSVTYETSSPSKVNRSYIIPKEHLHPGANTIAIRVMDHAGSGGLKDKYSDIWIASKDYPQNRIPLAGIWKYKIVKKYDSFRSRFANHKSPMVLYNGMRHPVQQYRIRGVIWYQGEANSARGYEYRTLFPAMIADWRQAWGMGDFPFYFVQIAPFNYFREDSSAELREAQLMALSVPNTGMAVTWDIATPDDIHPRNKQDVGKRLALWALSKTYDHPVPSLSGPLYKTMKIDEERIRIFFDHADKGLKSKGGPLQHFEIAGTDRVFYPAKATIDGDTLLVSSPEVPKPVAVRMGWSNAPAPNLFNGYDLPASPFRTDTWPGGSCPGTGPLATRKAT